MDNHNDIDHENDDLVSIESLSGVASIAGKILAIMGAGALLTDGLKWGVSTVNNLIKFKNDTNINSVTQAAKSNVVISRVFIDDILENDTDTISAVLDYAHIMYANLIIITLNLNNFVSSGRTVSDVLKPLSYESLKPFVSLDDYVSESIKTSKNTFDNNDKNNTPTPTLNSTTTGAKEIEQVAPNLLPIGKVFTYNMKVPTADGKDVVEYPIQLMVQMSPYYINNNTLQNILGEKSNLSWTNRFIQLRTGEISFWKDFLFNVDILKKNKELMKKDKTGAYSEYLNLVNSKNKGFVSKFTDIIANMIDDQKRNLSQNLANTVFIVSDDTLAEVKAKYNIDLYNKSHRAQFFKVSYSMILISLDNYGNVYIMFNGEDNVSKYTLTQLKSKKKGMNNDVVSVLTQLVAGNLK